LTQVSVGEGKRVDLPKSIGRYEILDWVGRGGMGVLYRAQDPVLERDVAIKVMSADFSGDEIGRGRFYREARAVARLQHRNIVTLFDFGEEHGSPYIVMEFLRGQTLAARLRTGPPLSVDEALDIAAQLGTGLHFAHAHGIIHRDVKPANIWLLDDGGVKLLDFGIAKFGESTLTTAGDVVGSVSYMSPEQLSGAPVDTRSDIFSAGIVLYELLAGRRPFQGETPTAIMMRIIHDDPPPIEQATTLPQGLAHIVGRALMKSTSRRYQHGAELASDLQALRATLRGGATGTKARPQSLIETGESDDDVLRQDVVAHSTGRAPDADLVGDALLGERPHTPRPFPAASTATRRWLPASAAAGFLVAAIVGFLIFREGSTSVSGGTTSAPPATSPASPGSTAPGKPGAPSTPAPEPVKPPDAHAEPASPRVPPPPATPRVEAPAPSAAPPPTASVPAAGTLVTITGPYPFEVSIEGGIVSKKASRHELRLSGKQTIRLRASEYALDRRIPVDARGGAAVRLSAPPLGRLTLRTPYETCQVLANGFSLGYPPIVEQPLASGNYRIVLSCPDGEKHTEAAQITAGQTETLLIR
jgi:serine/threonine-protein kinase